MTNCLIQLTPRYNIDSGHQNRYQKRLSWINLMIKVCTSAMKLLIGIFMRYPKMSLENNLLPTLDDAAVRDALSILV